MSPATVVSGGAGTLEVEEECTSNYPVAVATHGQIVNQPQLFWDALKSFHYKFGTKFMIPVIGKKELDLHLLYLQVTTRGGYDKVVADKKWREVSCVFNFSPTTTSASFVLKKHYHTILYHFEQLYFFNLQVPTAAPFSPVTEQPLPLGQYICGPDMADRDKYSFKGSMSIPATGTIEAKFDCGYLVSIKLGSDILQGVLYHPDQPSPCTAIVPYNPHNNNHRQPTSSRRKRRKRKWGRDPSHPKPNRSGYNFFFAEKHSSLKSLYPNREREFTKMIGESWNKLSKEERMVYQNIGLRDKERYRRELKEYHEKLKMGLLPILNAAENGGSAALC